MVRLHEKDINSPEYFDKMWQLPGSHYDTVRLQALCKRIKDKDKVVELGCGVFGFAQFASEHLKFDLHVCAVDFSTVALNKAKAAAPKLHTFNCNVLSTPFQEEAFDVVGAGELIEHMEKPEALVAEMARICKLDGWLTISTVDTKCPNAIKHGDYAEHLYEFTKDDLVDLFSPYGKVEYSIVGDYHIVETQKF